MVRSIFFSLQMSLVWDISIMVTFIGMWWAEHKQRVMLVAREPAVAYSPRWFGPDRRSTRE